MDYFHDLGKIIAIYLDPQQIEAVHQAYVFAETHHQGQTRLSGEPYITHPVAVAKTLAEMRLDYKSLMAALMHDLIEDTGVTKDTLKEKFGDEVAELVDGVSKLTQITFETRAEAQAENFRKMVLAMVRDIRVIIIKLADRLHNMQTMEVVPLKKRRRIARETLEIYAPIANRLGMHNFRVAFEELGFAALYPLRYKVLKKAVSATHGNRREILSKIESHLTLHLKTHQVNAIKVFGREKHLYSIYKKMRHKGLTFLEVMDVYGVRIIVDSIDSCYRALGVVHNLYKPIPERFKDYIAIPKANGYQSLHTTLFGPYGVPIEVQIRSKEMDRLADSGIAAHWLYKNADETEPTAAHVRAREWLHGLLEMQQSTGSSLEFIENVKIDLFPDEVYVFTPKGDIMELPSKACAVDFAYAVHSDVGNSCVAAKINRRLAPLSTPLMNGQTVEIITAPGARPNPAWLNFVITGKARSTIRNYIKSQRKAESIDLGKRLLANSLATLDNSFETIPADHIQSVLQELNYEDFDTLLEAIGLGNQLALLIAQRLIHPQNQMDQETLLPSIQPSPIFIKGSEGMVVIFSDCCRPIPNDPIVGVVSAGRGLQIHVEGCKHIDKLRQRTEMFVPVAWEEKITGDFRVDIRIETLNQRGVLAKLATIIADAAANIDNISVDQRDEKYSIVYMTISIKDRAHLAQVMRRIRSMKFVDRITRDRH